jgi:integrase
MASVVKRPNSKFWHAAFRVPQDDGKSKLVFRSTKKTKRSEAMKSAVLMEQASNDEANTTDEQARSILSVITRATERATRGTLTVKRGYDFIREITMIATGEDLKMRTLDEWIDEWLGKQSSLESSSIDAYRKYTSDFLEFMGERKHLTIQGVTSDDIKEFAKSLVTQKTSKTTQRNKLKCIRAVFSDALAVGIVDINPSAKHKLPQAEVSLQRQPFDAGEVNALLLTAHDDEWRRFLTLATFTGLRMGDCMSITWDRIDMKKKTIKLIPKKTQASGTKVTIPIHVTLYTALNEVKKKDRSGSVFPAISKMRGDGARGMSTRFVQLMGEAGVSRGDSHINAAGRTIYEKSFHSFRHTLTSWLANSGVPQEVRMKITGHKNKSVHDLYTHLEAQVLTDAMSSIPTLTDSK